MMEIESKIEEAAVLLGGSQQAIALTGAGISTPSGIPDFRSPGSGLWRNVDPMEIASIYSFKRAPVAFYDWIHPFAKLTIEADANPAHVALAQLEKCGLLHAVITQNVDMLHSKAGSKSVFELHGHMREMTCLTCYSTVDSDPFMEAFIDRGDVPYCDSCGGILKPNLILVGEQLPMDMVIQARRLITTSDVMLVIGTSLQTYPVSELPFTASDSGCRLIIINYEPTPADYLADVVIHANVVDVLPKLAAPFINSESRQ